MRNGFTIAASAGLEDEPMPRLRSSDPRVDRKIGARLARIRETRSLSQSELSRRLGIAQPIVCSYEKGRVRLHGELILRLTRILDVTADQILGRREVPQHGAQGDPEILRRVNKMAALPRRDRDALLRTIDAFLTAGRRQ